MTSSTLMNAQEQENILLSDKNNIQVTSNLDTYENLKANTTLGGTVMVTHLQKDLIDINSFRLGVKPLKVKLVESTDMSPADTLVVTIYKFQLEGLPVGKHKLPPIQVKVANKFYEAPPLVIEIF